MRTTRLALLGVLLAAGLAGCGGAEPTDGTPRPAAPPPLDAAALDRYLEVVPALRAAGATFDVTRPADADVVRAQTTRLVYREAYDDALAAGGFDWPAFRALHARVMAGLGAVAVEDATAERMAELESQRANLTPEQYEMMKAGLEGSGAAFADVPEEVRALVRARREEIVAAWR